MGYSIKILSSEEFDKLPYRHASIALGVADPKSNTAYVRHSAHSELNKYLIDHEFEHLIEDHPTDEIEGVRYKIPLIGPLISGLGAGLVGKAAPAFAQSFLPSFAGGIAKAGTGLGTVLGTKGLFGGLQSVGQSLYGGLKKAGSGLMGLFQGGGASGSLPKTAQITGLGGPQYQPQPQQQSQQGGQRSSFGGIFDMFKNPATLLGAGLMGAGLLKGYPKSPDLSQLPSVQQFKQVQSPGQSPLGQQSQGVISQNLMKQFNPLTSEEITAATADLDRSRLMAIKRLEGVYASSRPGTDYTTDTNYKQDLSNIEREYSEAKANMVANRTRTAEAYFDEKQLKNLALAKDWSTEEAEFVYKFRNELAQMDVDQIMLQFKVDYQKAIDWKQTAVQLGRDLFLSGVGIPQVQEV